MLCEGAGRSWFEGTQQLHVFFGDGKGYVAMIRGKDLDEEAHLPLYIFSKLGTYHHDNGIQASPYRPAGKVLCKVCRHISARDSG